MTKKSTSSIHRVPSAGGVEHGYPQGHLGHLTASEEKALSEFKVLLEEKNLWTPGPPPSHDDPTLIRYLRARKWVVQDAYGQFSDTEKFRKANDIGVLYDTMDIEAYETSKKLYPRFVGRRDRRGIPIYVYQVRHLDSSVISKYEKSADTTFSQAKTDGKTPGKLLRLFALYENLTRFIQPLSTECTDRDNAETPITLSTNIVDISHVTLKMFWNLKNHMQAASQLATSHYPETLDRIFIIGAPPFFNTVWGWIKRWFDPVTVSKIFILGHAEVLPVLSSFIDIKNIPKAYGGELEWDFFDEPRWDDPEIERILTFQNGHTKFPAGPMYMRPAADGKTMELVAVGSEEQKLRKEVFATVPKAFPSSANGAAVKTAPVDPETEKPLVAPAATNSDIPQVDPIAD
ncbi:CRAL-TRIO domain-containing protein [Truncatella angustata]|uniref:CRAL-TRIO domain-containing protein n=1 Tax=Truncatella angustata TaxID=152316 RepID=A0A9P8UUB2_9PEZI|nr:CRAL-TRIO domain-containing protein [Truncatella angustata]KAH6659274.1 CRAL-TRIO domain-containing protein [Truncatella angustata]